MFLTVVNTVLCRHASEGPTDPAALEVTPGMGSVGSVTPRGCPSSSSDLGALTGASGVGQGRHRSVLAFDSPGDRDRCGDGSLSNRGSPVSDQENVMPQR